MSLGWNPLCAGLAAVVYTALLGCARAEGLAPPSPWSLAGEVAASTYSEAPGRVSGVFRAVGLGVHGAYHWGDLGAGLGLETNVWRTEDGAGGADWLAALLLGAEGELRMAGDRLRARLGSGLAILLEGSAADAPGATGFFVDVRPVGFRWTVAGSTLVVDPMSLVVVVPDAGGIPIVDVQYRFAIAFEVGR